MQNVNPGPRLAIGSAFKLWVLLALDSKLRSASEHAWASSLMIRDELKSLPPGTLQNVPAGTPLSLREFAQKMISISDNTGTDHLIDFVGRTAVESAQTDAAHGEPSINVPWFYTRELFALKGWATPAQLAEFRQASLMEKRTLLD